MCDGVSDDDDDDDDAVTLSIYGGNVIVIGV